MIFILTSDLSLAEFILILPEPVPHTAKRGHSSTNLTMLKKTFTSLACLLLAAASYAGEAAPAKEPVAPTIAPEPEEISYSNFSLAYGYQSADFLGQDVDAHGIVAGLEFSPVKHLYFALNGGWSNVELDLGGLGLGVNDADFDYWTVNVGVGGYIPLTRNIHFVTEVGASYASLDINDFGANFNLDEDWGVYVSPHFRAKFGIVETHLGVTYNSNDVVPAEYNLFLRLFVEVAPHVDLFVNGSLGLEEQEFFDDVFGVQAGVRVKF